jgi:predicted Zn-dependent protease
MREPTYLSEAESRELAARALAMSRADEGRVNISSGTESNTRFAGNQITTSGDIRNATVTVNSAFGSRVGSATTNRFDDESLRQVVETSEQLARLAPEDPEYMGQLGPQSYPPGIDAWFESTAALDSDTRAAAVREVTRTAANRGVVSTGFFPVRGVSRAVATSRGLFAFERSTGASFSITARTSDGRGSGWAGRGILDWTEAQAGIEDLAARAVEKAERSRDPQPIDPGPWTVVLEPQAAANITGFIFGELSARSADEGRSFFSRQAGATAIGERLLDERVTLYSDPADPQLYTTAFNAEGLPNRRMVWFEGGVLRNLVYDRYWAQRQGMEPTGFPSGFAMIGGDATIDEMIASTERGLLVTRFWYMRSVNPRTILFTGLTRDGTFLIENGRVTRPVQNLRWNESPMHVLDNIEMIGRAERVLPSEDSGVAAAVIMPALKVRDFNFTSVSDAV